MAEGRTAREIAEELGIPFGTANSRRHAFLNATVVDDRHLERQIAIFLHYGLEPENVRDLYHLSDDEIALILAKHPFVE